MTKPTKWHVHPKKTQSSLGIRRAWSVLAVHMKKQWTHCFFMWTAKTDQARRMPRLDWVFFGCTCHLEAKASQTGRMPRLIGVVAGRTGHFVGFVMRRLILFPGTYGLKPHLFPELYVSLWHLIASLKRARHQLQIHCTMAILGSQDLLAWRRQFCRGQWKEQEGEEDRKMMGR